MKNKKNEIVKVDNWYDKLLLDLQKLEFTGIVLTKWNIGKRIVEDELKFQKPEYGNKRIENLAKDTETSVRDIYRCIQFFKKCHAVTELKDRSWNYVANKYLPEPISEIEKQNRIEEKQNLIEEVRKKGKYQIIYADPAWNYFAGGYKNQSPTTIQTLKEIIGKVIF